MQQGRIRVYAWEFPVRFTHWINVLSIITLSVTGFYIGAPFMHALSTSEYIMGWMRFIHFLAGYAFLFSIIIRLYWAFAGNKYANWRAIVPVTSRQRTDLVDTAKFYMFLRKEPPYAVGHTALAGLSYVGLFALFAFQIVSGFALYYLGNSTAAAMFLGGWLNRIMNMQTIRLLHHLVMYVIVPFAMIHVYIAWYLDIKERNGVMGSIFGGYKFVTGKEWE